MATSIRAKLLRWATRKGLTSFAKQMVKLGADLEARSGHGRTPLLLAVQTGNPELCEHLIENMEPKVAISEIKRAKHHILLDRQIKLKLNKTPVATQSEGSSDDDSWRMMQALNSNLPEQEKSVEMLKFAISIGRTEALESLLSKVEDLDQRLNSGLTLRQQLIHRASDCRTLDAAVIMVKALIPRDFTPEQVQAVLSKENKQNGTSPLIYAVVNENAPLVEYLLEKRVSHTERNSKGISPLQKAAAIGTISIVQRLIPGCDLTLADNLGLSALTKACGNGHKTVAQSLLKAAGRQGLDLVATIINQQDNSGMTSLHHAAQGGHTKTVKLLLKHNPDTTVKTHPSYTGEAKTAQQYAANKTILELIKRHINKQELGTSQQTASKHTTPRRPNRNSHTASALDQKTKLSTDTSPPQASPP